MVGPHFLRVFFVFCNKIIVYLLLGFYGIPAILGPFWHHHGNDCAHTFCGDGCHKSVSKASSCRPAANDTAKAKVCSCKHHAQSRSQVKTEVAKRTPARLGKQIEVIGDWQQHADSHFCSICHFYSCVGELPSTLLTTDQDPFLQSQVILTLSAWQHAPRRFQARAPPLA